MTLTECEYIWEPVWKSSDGNEVHTGVYFSSKRLADDYIRTEMPQYTSVEATQSSLWHDGGSGDNKTYYKFVSNRPVEVLVDAEAARASALKKLTPKERKALGL